MRQKYTRSFCCCKTSLLPRGHYCLGFIAIPSGNYCTLILLQSLGKPTGSSLAEPRGSLKVLDITSDYDSELIRKEKNFFRSVTSKRFPLSFFARIRNGKNFTTLLSLMRSVTELRRQTRHNEGAVEAISFYYK